RSPRCSCRQPILARLGRLHGLHFALPAPLRRLENGAVFACVPVRQARAVSSCTPQHHVRVSAVRKTAERVEGPKSPTHFKPLALIEVEGARIAGGDVQQNATEATRARRLKRGAKQRSTEPLPPMGRMDGEVGKFEPSGAALRSAKTHD